ncbi:hypothetical protein AB0D16_19310 [Streptomyces sp. NPDC048161]|uniref:hypothetical protein n=1 Tax=unclassified Streptomyces TaxID=2593676 RepID=UPI001F4704D7|nr:MULTISPECIES: hypothetical protein [unclassified Streptomyces]MEE1744106.1 hypothetical protein [Streptomyces sp. JV184]
MPSSPSTAPTEDHQFRLGHLAAFLRESKLIQDTWSVYSDEQTDIDGVPYDEHDYALHQDRRHAETWRAFEQVRYSGETLLATAEHQLQQLPSHKIQARWVWELGTLHTALEQLRTLQSEWVEFRDSLPASAGPGTEQYDDPLADRNADAWSSLDDWTTHGQSILDIHVAARQAPSLLTTSAPVRVPAPATRTGTVRR